MVVMLCHLLKLLSQLVHVWGRKKGQKGVSGRGFEGHQWKMGMCTEMQEKQPSLRAEARSGYRW